MKNQGLRNYLMACAAEADRRDAEARRERAERQANCKHSNLSRPVHHGLGYMGQHCIDCGKDFGYYDRG
jgi:hypothetical protein